METKYELTHSELVAVFKEWYSFAVDNPDECEVIDASEETAISGAKSFVHFLEKVRGN